MSRCCPQPDNSESLQPGDLRHLKLTSNSNVQMDFKTTDLKQEIEGNFGEGIADPEVS